MTLQEFARICETKHWMYEGVRVVGDLDAPVKKVAVLGGDGNKYIQQAK